MEITATPLPPAPAKPATGVLSAKLNQRIAWLSFGFAAALLIVLAVSLPWRQLHVDDGWLGEYAYWQAKVGHVRSDLLLDYPYYGQTVKVCHKLWLWQGAWVIKTVGWGVAPLKGLSLAYAVAAVGMFAAFARFYGWGVAGFGAALFISHSLVFEMALVFRPDVAVAFLALAALYAAQQALRASGGAALSWWAAGGLAVGLAGANHLNGLALAPGLVMCWAAHQASLRPRRQALELACMGLGGILGMAYYFHDMLTAHDWHIYRTQLNGVPGLQQTYFQWYSPIFKLFKEHERYFHSERELFFSAALVVSLSFGARRMPVSFRPLLWFAAGAALGVALLVHGKTTKYLTMLLPVYSLLLAGFLLSLPKPKRLHRRAWRTVVGLLALHLAVSLYYGLGKFTWSRAGMAEATALKQLNTSIPPGMPVVGPFEMVFQALPGRKLVSKLGFAEILPNGTEIYRVERAPSRGFRYVVLPTHDLKLSPYLKAPPARQAGAFTLFVLD